MGSLGFTVFVYRLPFFVNTKKSQALEINRCIHCAKFICSLYKRMLEKPVLPLGKGELEGVTPFLRGDFSNIL
jgi:hypothetical protein